MRLATALLASALLLVPTAPRAWSDAGHRIVAAIAEERLSPAARRLVREILGSKAMSDHDVATWADDVRNARNGAWHYVNIPLDADGYVTARDCPRAGCAVAALERAAAALRDADDAIELADSLRWLVHLAGDLHQPLHAGELRDRGGNDTWVRIGKRKQPVSLHRAWDFHVVGPILAGRDPVVAGRALAAAIAPADAAAWSRELSPASWATESHRRARQIYAEVRARPVAGGYVVLPGEYAVEHRAMTARALSEAGVRLAALLDRIAAERESRADRR